MADSRLEPDGTPGPPTAGNPQALRALAHPLRWKLIDLLGTEGSATATRCAQALSESVASCSYHLRILAKYGYIEQVPERVGREKPWRLLTPQQVLPAPTPDAGSAHAARAAMAAFLDHELGRLKDRLRDADAESEAWQPFVSGVTALLSEQEYREVREQIEGLLEPFAERARKPPAPAPGRREVRLFGAVTVAPRGAADPGS